MIEFFRRWFGARTAAAPSAGADDPRVSAGHFGKLVAGVRDYAVFLLDPLGRVATWNAGAERIKGYRAEQIIGRHFSTFYPPDAIASGWPEHELKIAGETGRFEDEGWRLRRDGSKFWASVVITALRDEAGNLTGFLKITRDLTDRKQAEEKLRLSEERFRSIVDGVKDYAIFMLDPLGRVATWNSGAERLKGYTAAEIVGEHFSRFYPREAVDRGWPDEELRRATADGRFEDEGWRVRKDGSTFWADVVITALRDEQGVLRGFAKVTRDLTERKLSEENARRLLREEAARQAAEAAAAEIERQREQLRITLASIGDAVIVTDDRAAVTFLNPVAATLTGWSLGESLGRPLDEVFCIHDEETGARVENPVERVFRERRVVELANHTALRSRDGRSIPIEDTAAPIRGLDGAIVGAVLVFRDVTEARRANEARRHLAAIVESSDDAIIGQTLDGRIASWNRGAERLYGYTADEIVGRSIATLVPPEHRGEAPRLLERVGRGEYVDHFETERVRKDGRRVDVSLTISPIRDGDGRVVGASKIARDITARKRDDRRKTEFLALLAHELRNPLAPLRNALEVMRLAGDDAAAVGAARTLMERQLHHLVRLVDDLLDVSRITRGKLQLRKERIALAEPLGQAIDACRATIAEHGQTLDATLPDDSAYVDADPTRLVQVFSNLLNNAAKYGATGGRVTVRGERDGAWAVIGVRDEGIGVPPEMLPRIFEMFMQVDRSLEKSHGGLGVGLAIAQSLVEMHGGSIEARSEGHGRGTEFVVRLPLAPPPVAGVSVAESERRGSGSSRRVLVVDDNLDAARSLAAMLGIMGHEVHVAHDGEAGLRAAEELRPEVILLDIGMPKLNGFEVARRIREASWGRDATLAALTGWGQEEDRRRSREAGFDVHLVKPVEPAAVERLLADAPRVDRPAAAVPERET